MCINYSKTISAIRGQYVMPKYNPPPPPQQQQQTEGKNRKSMAPKVYDVTILF